MQPQMEIAIFIYQTYSKLLVLKANAEQRKISEADCLSTKHRSHNFVTHPQKLKPLEFDLERPK